VSFYRKLQAIEGTLIVTEPSEPVRKVLQMVGLAEHLMPSVPAAARPTEQLESGRVIDRDNVTLEIFDLGAGSARMTCRAVGQPALLNGCSFSQTDCRSLAFPETSIAVGLGAFGGGFEECRERFGEFFSVAGASAYQPTDGSNVPDVSLAEGDFVPELQVLYGIVCDGPISALARFEVKAGAPAVGLTELVDACLEGANAKRAAVVIVAESAGLSGASLRKPPVTGASGGAPFGHPEIRDWLSFTAEREYVRSLALVVGVAARGEEDGLRDWVRPLYPGNAIMGHFHAAAFSYRPLQRGLIDLRKTVKSLFEGETMQGLLHLIGDDRGSSGVAESEFVRGACWIAPIDELTTEGR